jgi:uncharacterized membrane protein YbhN (UPF0104 family)
MVASEPSASELTIAPELAIDLRTLARRAAVPAALAAALIAVVILGGGRVGAVADALKRTLSVSPAWALVAIGFETVSIAAYIVLLSLVAGRATGRIRTRESAQITFAGTAATRLLPTAGAGGAALTLWTLRQAGLSARGAAQTLLSFLVLLYAVFLTAIAVAGLSLLMTSTGPLALSATASAAALLAIGVALALARRPEARDYDGAGRPGLRGRVGEAAGLLGAAIRDARHPDLRMLGAIGYWGFDAAVLWAMLHAFGASPAIAVVVLAYFVGQVANTLPLPGSVSGGIAGVLIAFGLPAAVALAAVLAYRTIAVWLPVPAAIAVLPGFRSTVARWRAEDAAA